MVLWKLIWDINMSLYELKYAFILVLPVNTNKIKGSHCKLNSYVSHELAVQNLLQEFPFKSL